jgi:hypothetical protein
MRGLSVEWTKHLEAGAKKQFEDLVRNTTTVLTRLRAIIEEKDAVLTKQETTLESYDTPSWAYKQAYLNGKRAAYREIRDLTNFLDQRNS